MLDSFFPVFVRREADIRADMDLRANEGKTLGDPNWIDTRPGSTFWNDTQPIVKELATAYDRMNELTAASILSTSWGEYLDAHAANYGVERNPAVAATGEYTFYGTDGTVVGAGVIVQPSQDDPNEEVPIFKTTTTGTISGGSVTLPIRATEEGAFGNVNAGAIDTIFGVTVTSGTNVAATANGADEETDVEFKARLLELFAGAKNGNRADYKREFLTRFPEIGYVQIYPNNPDPGDVLAVIANKDKDAFSSVTEYQDYMDPSPQGQGNGWAPINHFVTVATPTTVSIYVTSDVSYATGYSQNGAGGTIALQNEIELAVADYLNTLGPGDDVVLAKVEAAIVLVDGVTDAVTTKIGTAPSPAGTSNVTIGDMQVSKLAVSGAVVLS